MKNLIKKYEIKYYFQTRTSRELTIYYENETTIKKAWKKFKIGKPKMYGFKIDEISHYTKAEYDVKQKKYVEKTKEIMYLSRKINLTKTSICIYEL